MGEKRRIRSIIRSTISINDHIATRLQSLTPSKGSDQAHLQGAGNVVLREALIVLGDILEFVLECEHPRRVNLALDDKIQKIGVILGSLSSVTK